MTSLAKIWRNRIEAGTQLYANCPSWIKADVTTLLKEDVASGVITAEQYKSFTGEDYVVA